VVTITLEPCGLGFPQKIAVFQFIPAAGTGFHYCVMIDEITRAPPPHPGAGRGYTNSVVTAEDLQYR